MLSEGLAYLLRLYSVCKRSDRLVTPSLLSFQGFREFGDLGQRRGFLALLEPLNLAQAVFDDG